MRKGYLLFILFVALTTNMCANTILPSIDYPMKLVDGDTIYRIIPSADNTYGYEILVNNRLLIRQPTIPGLPGNKGFARKSDAEKVARLVIKKLQKGIMPPTIETKELDNLKIKY
jgi:hypothetical protein